MLYGDQLLSSEVILLLFTVGGICLFFMGLVGLIVGFFEVDAIRDGISIEIALDKSVSDGIKLNDDSGYLAAPEIYKDVNFNQDILAFDDTNPEYISFSVYITENFSTLVIQEVCRASTGDQGGIIMERELWYRIIRNKTNITAWSNESEVISLQQISMPAHENYFEVESKIPIEKFTINGIPIKSGDEIQIIYATNPPSGPPYLGDWLLRRLTVLLQH